MERLRNIECTHEKCVKIRNVYVCIKCNRKFTEKQYEKENEKNDNVSIK